MKNIFLLILLFLSTNLIAQDTNIDSLLVELEQATDEKTKVDLYQLVATNYLVTDLDTSIFFSEKGLALAKQINYTKGTIRCLNAIGNYKERKTLYEEALMIYKEALAISQEKKDTASLAIILNNIAIVHTRTGAYDKAIKLYFEGLHAEEVVGNQKGVAEAYNNIGIIYYYQRQLDKAVDYFEKSIAIEEKLGHTDILKKGYNNIGAVCDYLEQHEKALLYYQKAYALSQQLKDQRDMASNLGNIAISYYKMKKFDLALDYHGQSLAIKEKMGDYRGICYSHNNFASLSKAKGNWAAAEEFYQKSLAISLDKGIKEMQNETYRNLATLFSEQKDYQKANDYLNKYILVRDSMLSEQNSKAVAEMESKYETEKKEKEILAQQAVLAEQNLKIEQKNTQLLTIGSTTVILLLLGLLYFNYQYQKTKRLEKEKELQEVNAKLETQAKLQKQRLRISRDLHDNIGAQLTFIISSIDNLKYGFKLENEKLVSKLKGISTFVGTTIHDLRDTIWAMNKDAISFDDLEARIRTFLVKAKGAAEQIDFSFDLDKSVQKDYVFSSVEGMNIYRIIQESVNNALKYANATKVSVSIIEQDNKLKFKIEDNGEGFDMDLVDMGNGLNNMKKRTGEIGGIWNIHSKPNQGTFVSLELSKHYKKEITPTK